MFSFIYFFEICYFDVFCLPHVVWLFYLSQKKIDSYLVIKEKLKNDGHVAFLIQKKRFA